MNALQNTFAALLSAFARSAPFDSLRSLRAGCGARKCHCAAFRNGPLIWSVVLLAAASPAKADEIYRWIDSEGREHFGTQPLNNKARPADLPQVKRENLGEKIEAIKQNTPPSCVEHGGIDCAKGADQDGSVFCADGWADAILPFRFACLEAKLQAERFEIQPKNGPAFDLSKRNDVRKLLAQIPAEAVLVVVVRNTTPVEAGGLDARVSALKPPLALSGPAAIGPYGVGEFKAAVDGMLTAAILKTKGTIWKVGCTNCSNTATGRIADVGKS